MGIHLGPVVVGDIGTASRINYTIVGDAVNATQRLESLGKTIDPNAEAIALVSEEIFAAAPADFQFIERGAHLVKGKQESLNVFQPTGGPEESTSAAFSARRAPKRHDCIADKLVDRAAFLFDAGGDEREMDQ